MVVKEKIKRYFIIVCFLVMVVGVTYWLFFYSQLSEDYPLKIVDSFEIKVIDYEIERGGFFDGNYYRIISEERNFIVDTTEVFDYNLERFNLNSISKGDNLICKEVNKGWFDGYVCGTEEKEIPQDKDLMLIEKIIIIFMGIFTITIVFRSV